jgi:hypothetical protein
MIELFFVKQTYPSARRKLQREKYVKCLIIRCMSKDMTCITLDITIRKCSVNVYSSLETSKINKNLHGKSPSHVRRKPVVSYVKNTSGSGFHLIAFPLFLSTYLPKKIVEKEVVCKKAESSIR